MGCILFSVCWTYVLSPKDRIVNKKKKLIKVHKKKYHNNYVTAGSNDSGVIFISKMVKASGVKVTRHFEYPKNLKKVHLDVIRYNGVFDIHVIVDKTNKEPSIEIKGDESFVDLVSVATDPLPNVKLGYIGVSFVTSKAFAIS